VDSFRVVGPATAVLVALLALGIGASSASAEPLSMTFTEARANVGEKQLSDEALFEAPDTAPFEAEIDPGTGAITAGHLDVPDFSTFITDPVDADVTVQFEIGVITGTFDEETGALEGSGTAGGTLTANGRTCTVTTTPDPLILSTAGSSGGSSPRLGAPFTAGLTGAGAIAGQWTDMHAEPVTPEDTTVCETVDERIGGPGGIWLEQEGDLVPPPAPQLTGTNPASPSLSGTPRILGAAETGSKVSVYGSASCAGLPVATGSAAELGSLGISVAVVEGVTASFSATATDPAGNTSGCSAPIAYTRLKAPTDPGGDDGTPPPPAPAPPPTAGVCIVPKLVGKTLRRAKRALKAADCKLGKVRKPKRVKRIKRKRRWVLVVRSSSPRRGARPADRKVDLELRLKRRKTRR
jgi:hypothetical protein